MSKQTVLKQKAADLEVISKAIAVSEENLKVCQEDYNQKWLAFKEAEQNLSDTRLLLQAQIQKQYNEAQVMHEVIDRACTKVEIGHAERCPY